MTDTYVTGGTYSAGTATFTNNTGGTFSVTGFSSLQYFVTGSTPSGMTLNNGDRWFDTTTGDELVWINDGNSSQWLQICCGGGGILVGAYLPLSGGTVTGPAQFTNGLTANTISATTYLNLPTDVFVTGATYSNNTFTYTNNTGGTFNVLFNTVTGLTVNGNLTVTGSTSSGTISATTYQNLPISGLTAGQNISISGSNGNFTISVTGVTSGSNFTGGTVSGATNFTGGLTANTISATTYLNLPTDVYVTGGTYSAGTTTFTNNTGGTFSVTGFSTTTPFTGGTVSGATNFTNGLTANTISATTYYNLPVDVFVTGGTYTSGNAIFTNNTGGTFTVTGFAIGGGGGQIFYLNISQSKGTNRYLSTTASTAAEQSTGATIAAGGTGTIASFQSDVLNTTLIPGGIWSFYLHSYKQNNNASFNIFVEVYKRTSGGTETLLFTTDPTPVTTNSPNPSMGVSDAYFSGSPILVSDSIVARVRATNTSNQSHSVTLFSEGSQHYSYAVSTLQTQQGLTCDTLSGCSIIQTIQNNFNSYTATTNPLIYNSITGGTYSGGTLSLINNSGTTLQITGFTIGSNFTGGTVSGATNFTNGLTANTISATTYLNLPTDVFVTGGTYSAGTATFTNNTGGTFDVTGIITPFTGGTVSGPTNFTSGLSANTISATTYLNLPVTPVHIKIASMSGRFISSSLNTPSISQMYVGNSNFGWSYGDYDYDSNPDGFGNIRDIRFIYSNVGIPLPTDILSGDKIKICGMCYVPERGVQPTNETFYITVSYFTCRDYLTGRDFNVSTLIPVASYVFDETRAICFSEEIITNTTLPGCTTYLVVGMTAGNDEASEITYKFSYTLDSTQSTAAANLFIRNCCDPAYSEVIQNNGVAVGKSFVDGDGNCWSVESETTSDITGVRTLSTEYDNCVLCIDSNVCPENFVVQSCCGGGSETFTAALVGINVGDTFVDDFGFCWSVTNTTPTPITNVVTIGTVYSSTTCESLECTDANTCPNLLLIESCCRDMGLGYTTSDILGITVTVGDVFVDTFGICWIVASENNVGFPSLNFLSGSTIYGSDACETCITANSCEINLFYTVQNCCDETIEVVELPAQYSINLVLGLIHDTGAGCYDVLSWSDVGTPTLTGAIVSSTYTSQGNKGCGNCITNFLNNTCIGQKQCCTSYEALEGGLTITGYLCDGTWVLNQSVPKNTSVCMALALGVDPRTFTTSCCSFLVYNPSPTTNLVIDVTTCLGGGGILIVPPLETSGECVNCVSSASGPWEWAECP